ncbi:MAG: ABC transporter substrate-binding protein [Thermomicrobiales bacterium]
MTDHSPGGASDDDAWPGRHTTRRAFVHRALALGLLPAIGPAVPAAASPRALTAPQPPAVGTAGQQRGEGGELKMLQWQAPSQAGAHTAGGMNDVLAAALVSEPLLSILPDGTLVPALAREVPTLQNGLLAADLTRVTYRLRPGVTWSDGAPFTANDVVFTWRWVTDPANAATTAFIYAPIADVQALDDLTVEVRFAEPDPAWFMPFVGSVWGAVYPEHILSGGPDAADAFRTHPIGTGPFVVAEFAPNDRVVYAANPRYREPHKPFFSRVNLKGGGDAASAARAVLQTGDFDFAWSLLVEPEELRQLERGGKGRVVTTPGTTLQRIAFNFSDPNREVDGQRSEWRTPHPFLTDPAVRQALTLATDRLAIATHFFAGPPGEPPAANVLVGIPALESHDTSWRFDLDEAGRVLEAAGWRLADGVREKAGRRLEMVFVTATSPILQDIQALMKVNWEKIGVRVELRQVDPSVYFDPSPGNDQNLGHFYADVQMYASAPGSPFPLDYFGAWYSDDGANIAQRANGWTRLNDARYHNPAYDALYDAVAVETDPERATALFIAINDLLIEDYALIPLVQRAAEKYGIANSLRNENVAASSWEAIYWNIANWNRVR